VEFVLDRSDDRIEGYRVDLGVEALAPLGRGRWRPHATIDLHGLRAGAVRPAIARAVAQRDERPVLRLLIVHGKGLHSDRGGAILAGAVIDVLTEGPLAWRVRAFTAAPMRLGGIGALVVEIDARTGR
jgi:DNA-nicking Smr family endonuclease